MSAIGTMEPMQMLVMLIFLVGAVSLWHYVTKVYPEKMKQQNQKDTRMLDIEERRSKDQEKTNSYLRSSLDTQQVLLNQNTEAVKDLKSIMQTMAKTFRIVSEKLATHDAQSQQTNAFISTIYHEMPSKDDVATLRTDFQDHAKEAATKHDTHEIMEAIGKLSDRISENHERLYTKIESNHKD